MYRVELSDGGKIAAITSGTDAPVRFHAIWLRDNAWDSETRSPGNGQQLITLHDIPAGTRMEAAEVSARTLTLTFVPENRTIEYDIPWLLDHSYDRTGGKNAGWLAPQIETWDSGLMGSVPAADFDEVRNNPKQLYEWLRCVARIGFIKLVNGPVEDRSLMRVVELFGYVRQTNYGEYFEVRTKIDPSNLAYTGLGLQAHTDNPYRDPVPSLQVFYR